LKANFWLGLPVQDETVAIEVSEICRHLPSMTEVIVPLALIDQAPLQSQGCLQLFGSGLQPQLQFTAAPSPVAQASISQL
jgi:hypothetical protein